MGVIVKNLDKKKKILKLKWKIKLSYKNNYSHLIKHYYLSSYAVLQTGCVNHLESRIA